MRVRIANKKKYDVKRERERKHKGCVVQLCYLRLWNKVLNGYIFTIGQHVYNNEFLVEYL